MTSEYDDPTSKVQFKMDSRVHNAATITLFEEDHTLGALIHTHILEKDTHITFAGYRVPHPYLHQVELRLRTAEEDVYGPESAFSSSLDELVKGITSFRAALEPAFETYEKNNNKLASS
ncbi:hypothetical protein GEMRC1_002479 [Eukaryota sp. GEM-RC1]